MSDVSNWQEAPSLELGKTRFNYAVFNMSQKLRDNQDVYCFLLVNFSHLN